MKYYAVTICCKNSASYEEDRIQLAEATQFLEDQGSVPMQMHMEVQPTKGHLLHCHGIVCGNKKPYIPPAKAKQLRVNYLIKEISDLSGWNDYCRKEPIDPYWIYQQFHTNMFTSVPL